MGLLRSLIGALALVGPFWAGQAGAQQVRITTLADYSFTVANVAQDISISRNVCISSDTSTGRYGIRATGSGTANAFTLAGPGQALPYDVQWNTSPNQPTGTALVPGVTRSGMTTTGLGLNLNCVLGNDSASLVVALRSADLSRAIAGTYTGVLTFLIASE